MGFYRLGFPPVDISSFYRPRMKLRKGNVFTPVCDSVHAGGFTPPWAATSPRQSRHPPARYPMHRTVRILLECILVYFFHIHIKGSFTRSVSVSVPVSVPVKFLHYANGNGPFDGQNGFCTHSAR